MSWADPILPGATLGMLGGGQLGRMTAMVAKRMGYCVHIFTPEPDSPAAQVSDRATVAAFEDTEALEAFAREVEVVTLEFENIPFAALELLERHVPVRPNHDVLYVTQNRLREKAFLRDHGFPVTPFYPVLTSPQELEKGLRALGCPAILKTAGSGYDGKGQRKVSSLEEVEAAYAALGGQEGILEQLIPFETEFSVVAARGVKGEFAHFGLIENHHKNHILDVSLSPAPHLADVEVEALEIARGVLETLNVVGVMCIEFFLTADRRILINELAPRPHNSGHLTLEAFATSQFEQQVRAVCGLPLGSTRPLSPAAMINLLGDAWFPHTPDWAALDPEIKLHLYGKAEPRVGRKMGHLTTLADTAEQARARLERARRQLVAPV